MVGAGGVEPPSSSVSGNHRNRCATRRFPRSRPTVDGEVKRSPGVHLSALPTHWVDATGSHGGHSAQWSLAVNVLSTGTPLSSRTISDQIAGSSPLGRSAPRLNLLRPSPARR